jgi:hypothetical protein
MEFIENNEELEQPQQVLTEENNLNRFCIILTSTVYINPKKRFIFDTEAGSRLNNYLNSIKQWLDKTNLKIVLVENSGYTYPDLDDYVEKYKDRFEIISFKEEELDDETFDSVGAQAVRLPNDYLYTSKGTSEMFAIFHAHDKLSKLTKTADFIIKVTCRYFVPEFETFLSKVNIDDYLVLRQNSPDNCEIVGVNVNHFSDIFMPAHFRNSDGKWHHHIENVYKDRILTKFSEDKTLVCDVFQIEPTQQGGCNIQRTEL